MRGSGQHRAVDVAHVVLDFGGFATREQLFARGLSGGDLTAAVRLGQVWRVRRGYYATRESAPDAVAAVRVGGRLAGTSAAASFGLWSGFDRRVHVALPSNASRLRTQLPPSVSEFRTPDSSAREVVLHWLARRSSSSEIWRVTASEAIVQVANWADAETAIACLDTARGLVGLDDRMILELFRDEPAAVRARALASRSGSDSGVESVVRQRLLSLGIQVEQQVEFPGVGRVDMLVRGSRLVIEVDGKAFHSSPEQIENDRRRGAVLATLDHRQIRLSYDRVFGDWPWCVATVGSALS
jgi:very-short-patch-repair endonuclease